MFGFGHVSAYSSCQFFPGSEPEGWNKLLSCNHHGISNPRRKNRAHTEKPQPDGGRLRMCLSGQSTDQNSSKHIEAANMRNN